jgi:plasmid maintenance system killer protein
MTKILMDMNAVEFQRSLFKLEAIEQRALLNTLRKMTKLTWDALHVDKGIRWELIANKEQNIYSFRFSKKYRATAYRKNNVCVLLELFPDHDSAYK